METILYIETDKGSGTGFVFNPDGYAITCAHVVKGSKEIYVRVGTDENDIERAEIVGIDEHLDLAIIKLEGTDCHLSTTLDLGQTIQLGEEIIILGFPFGAKMSDDVSQMSVSLTRGYISSWQTKDGKKRVLLDISAKAGNSGSPVISMETGKVVGVLSGSVLGGVNNREEVNYMIPMFYLNELFSD